MLVVLPDVMDGIIALEQSFLRDPTNFNALLGKLETHKVVLTLPKFKFESDLDLETAIRNVNIYLDKNGVFKCLCITYVLTILLHKFNHSMTVIFISLYF
jgi:serine protease inhibitor